MKHKRIATVATAAALTLALGACGGDAGGASGGAYPSEDMEWTIAFGPGGGNDIMARTMVDILQRDELYPENIRVENREGGSGATGWGYLLGQAGEGYGISTTSGSFITTPLQADTGWTPTDFTPVGLLAADNARLIGSGKADFQTYDEWVDYATEKGSVVVGGIGTVNVDYILQQMIADAEGYTIEYVPYNEEGQMQTSLLSGAIDTMISNPGSIMGQVEAGQVTPPPLHRAAAPRGAPRRADRRGERHRRHALDAAWPDPPARRPGRGAGVVDRDHAGGRGDRCVAGVPRRELPARGRALG